MMDELECRAPRITEASITERIEGVDYATIRLAGQKMMFCGIKMRGGFVAVGKPATCISEENWRDEIGQKIAFDNTFDELWKLEAYRAKCS